MKNIKGANLYINLRKEEYITLQFGSLSAKVTMVGKTGDVWFGLAIEAPREIRVERSNRKTGFQPVEKGEK